MTSPAPESGYERAGKNRAEAWRRATSERQLHDKFWINMAVMLCLMLACVATAWHVRDHAAPFTWLFGFYAGMAAQRISDLITRKSNLP